MSKKTAIRDFVSDMAGITLGTALVALVIVPPVLGIVYASQLIFNAIMRLLGSL